MAKKILVIDDEELITKSLLKLLNKEGYEATIARSGKEALAKIDKTDFDLIISDVKMPEMDGIEAVKQIRTCLEKKNRKSVPEIIITGYADLEKYNKALELKVTDYIYKPFDNTKLLQVVKSSIG